MGVAGARFLVQIGGGGVIRGLYAAARAMAAEMTRQDVLAFNLANVDTTGFKRALVVSGVEGETLLARFQGTQLAVPIGRLTVGPIQEVVTDFQQGPLRETGRDLDIALVGEGFLVVQTPSGLAYTRDGRLGLDAQRRLVTRDGHLVLGLAGPLTVPPGRLSIDAGGNLVVNGTQVGRLQIVQFPDPSGLVRAGGGLYLSAGQEPQQAQGVTVRQGFLEGANVEPVLEMAQMLAGLRAYEASQKAVLTMDESIDRLLQAARVNA